MWLRPEAQGILHLPESPNPNLRPSQPVTKVSIQELRAEEKKHIKDVSSPGLDLGLLPSVAKWTVEMTERGILNIPGLSL